MNPGPPACSAGKSLSVVRPSARAVSPVYPDVRFLPTGGIGADDAAGYLALPSVLAVGGSWLVQSALLREGRFDEVERLARDVTGGRP